jgi:SAM-dependent methyltransferase
MKTAGAPDLPEIFHYWSNKHIAADMSRFGFSNPEEFFFHHSKILLKKLKGRRTNILSIGAGDCELEIRVAQRLLQWQLNDFVLECLERDKGKLDVAKSAVLEAGLDRHFRFTLVDPNHWKPYRKYGIVFADQSLHECWNLEGLLDSIKRSLQADGLFLISDSIGRNLNMCWPEAMRALEPLWDELPDNYRYNRILRRLEKHFINHDGSREGFGAIRSQDILTLLLERFNFKFFFPYGNIIFVFISQSFGHNFNADAAWDKDFIDRVHARDEAGMLGGELKPCSMLAVLTKQETELVLRHPVLTPGYCVRKVAGDHDHASESRRMGR